MALGIQLESQSVTSIVAEFSNRLLIATVCLELSMDSQGMPVCLAGMANVWSRTPCASSWDRSQDVAILVDLLEVCGNRGGSGGEFDWH